MSDKNYLDTAILLATKAHAGQKDKAGQPYILHLMRVALNVKSADARIVAFLHDIIEDTDYDESALLAAGFPAYIVLAVKTLTKRRGEPYDAFIRRVGHNDLAREVKLADLEDNMDMSRLPRVTEVDEERYRKYLRAHGYLLGATWSAASASLSKEQGQFRGGESSPEV